MKLKLAKTVFIKCTADYLTSVNSIGMNVDNVSILHPSSRRVEGEDFFHEFRIVQQQCSVTVIVDSIQLIELELNVDVNALISVYFIPSRFK